MIKKYTSLSLALSFVILSCSQNPKVEMTLLNTKTDALLQAISIVDTKTAWISGHQATIVNTSDGGNSWTVYQHSNDTFQFRDIHALDGENAVVMSAGPGELSRVFLFNINTGFEQVYVMPHAEGFLNTIEFWDDQNGLAFGDSFNGQLFVLKTTDGGRSWIRIDPTLLPAAGEEEGGFAASGTCITTLSEGKAWIGTGAGGNARVLRTSDYGRTWSASDVPIVKGAAAGITSIRMADESNGLIVGGDLAIQDQYTQNVAITNDGGQSWRLAAQPCTKGAFYGSDLMKWQAGYLMVACGPKGIDYSPNLGQTYVNLDTLNYWAVDLHPSGIGYASGTNGRLIKITIH